MKELLILSGKGGTGKTTIASGFIELGKIKAYADCDVDAPNLHLILSEKIDPKRSDYYGLDKAEIDQSLCTGCDLCRQHCAFDAIIKEEGQYKVDYFGCEGCGVCEYICPVNAIRLNTAIAGDLMLYESERVFSTAQLRMGSGNSGLLVTEVKKEMKSAAKDIELAIIDGSPGIGCPVIASLTGVDMVLIVAEPSISGISDMGRIIKATKRFGTKIAVCINKYDTNIQNTEKIESFCKENSLDLVGRIPFDKEVLKAINNGKNIVEVDCKAGLAIEDIYDKTIEILFNE